MFEQSIERIEEDAMLAALDGLPYANPYAVYTPEADAYRSGWFDGLAWAAYLSGQLLRRLGEEQ